MWSPEKRKPENRDYRGLAKSFAMTSQELLGDSEDGPKVAISSER